LATGSVTSRRRFKFDPMAWSDSATLTYNKIITMKTSSSKKATPTSAHAALHASLSWHVPRHFNMAEVCVRRWARLPDAAMRTAIVEHHGANEYADHSYATLQTAANKLAHLLIERGVQRGERVAIVMPQRFETAVAYMAILQMGAVAMPLSQLFGADALLFRLTDSEAVAAICDENTVAALSKVRAQAPALHTVIGVGFAEHSTDVGYAKASAAHSSQFKCVNTLAEDPALLIYTSGTTGNPKGALMPHRALIGNLSGFVCSQNWFGFDPANTRAADYATPPAGNEASNAVFWSPADWAWTGGLMDALLPTLYFGRPIIAYSGRFSAETAFEILQTYCVTHSFLFPTALKAMMKAFPQPREQFSLRLQGLMSAGEAVGDAVFDYCQQGLGVTVNEMFGQTEVNYIVGNCAMQAAALPAEHARWGWPAKAGSMGHAYPGHHVAVIDDAGHICPTGTAGDVAVHRLSPNGQPNPIFFLGYWKNEAATSTKFTGDPKNSWCRTGDMAVQDAEGYLWYQGRSDDMFKAAGYRIGPSEVENCLIKHPAVANAAVVPKPDGERGAVVKAYVVLSAGFKASKSLIATLQAHVRGKLAPYEYPKEIEFIDALPMTTTGKVQRRVLRAQEEARAQ
jgi:acetyl-CoA synthetase